MNEAAGGVSERNREFRRYRRSEHGSPFAISTEGLGRPVRPQPAELRHRLMTGGNDAGGLAWSPGEYLAQTADVLSDTIGLSAPAEHRCREYARHVARVFFQTGGMITFGTRGL
jgi:hypothetical protein